MKDKKLKIGVIGLGQRGAAYGMTDGSIGLLGNILNNSDKSINLSSSNIFIIPPYMNTCSYTNIILFNIFYVKIKIHLFKIFTF